MRGAVLDSGMTTTQAERWVRQTSDEDADDETCETAFFAIFGRAATDDDREQGLWSHLCAAVAAEAGR